LGRDIEINLLRTLVTIIDSGGFRRAAGVLHTTQPAVSQHVRRLEAIVDGPVFTRTRRPLNLSPAGRELLAHARRVVALNDELLERISATRTGEQFTIGCSVHFADGLKAVLADLALRQPHLRCRVVTGVSAMLEDKVSAGELDAAIVIAQADLPSSELLGQLPLSWFGHAPVAPEDPVPIAVMSERSVLRTHIVHTLTARRVPWRAVYECADPLGVLATVQAGLAYTALPANADQVSHSLHPVPPNTVLGPPPEPLPVSLVFSPGAKDRFVDAAHIAADAVLRGGPLVPEQAGSFVAC
jgi:DNA-binding transcriptional LysR family regulator